MKPKANDIIPFLQECGVRFTQDSNGKVVIDATGFDYEAFNEALRSYGQGLAVWYAQKLAIGRMRMIGGPLDGEKHGRFQVGHPMVHHCSHARWAVYVVAPDGRGIFLGYSTSRPKGVEKVAAHVRDSKWAAGKSIF